MTVWRACFLRGSRPRHADDAAAMVHWQPTHLQHDIDSSAALSWDCSSPQYSWQPAHWWQPWNGGLNERDGDQHAASSSTSVVRRPQVPPRRGTVQRRAARRRCGDTRRAARRCAEDVRDAVLPKVVPFDVVMLMPLAVFSAVLLDALLVSREAGPRRARRSGRRPRRCRCI